MGLVEAIVYGIIQGITEWLPISSSAHLRVVPAILGWNDPGAAFTATIQLGTTLAVILYFRKDLAAAIGAWFRSIKDPAIRETPEGRLGWGVFWGTFPIVILGLALKDFIEGPFRSLYVVSAMLIIFGLIMLWADKTKVGKRDMEHIQVNDGIVVGLWQCLALIPGVSRSGSTMTGSFLKGLDRPTAARFSFLLSLPSITGAGFYELYKSRHDILHQGQMMPVVVATVVSFVVGYASIAGLINYLRKHDLTVFVVWRMLLGSIILGLVLTNNIPAEEKPVLSGGTEPAASATK